MSDHEHATRAEERALIVAEAARAREVQRAAEARVRNALRAMLAVDARVTAATLRWDLWEGDDGEVSLCRTITARIGGVLWPDDDAGLREMQPQPDWLAFADAVDAVRQASLGASGDDGEEWTEVRS